MKKRLDAATALVHRPPLVFLDEPTTGLDPTARNRLWDYFQRINELGTTIFLTTQYLEEADQLCDRLAVILDGEIVAEGSPTDLKCEVGSEVLDVELEGGPSARRQAATIAREFDAFADASVTETDEDIIRSCVSFYRWLRAEIVPDIRFINCAESSLNLLFQGRQVRDKTVLEPFVESIPASFYRVEFR